MSFIIRALGAFLLFYIVNNLLKKFMGSGQKEKKVYTQKKDSLDVEADFEVIQED